MNNIDSRTVVCYILHKAVIHIIGDKKCNNKWNLDITLSDTYDFTEFKVLREYFEDDELMKIAAVIGNNIAILGTNCKVVHPYKITIKFKIENWEGS